MCNAGLGFIMCVAEHIKSPCLKLIQLSGKPGGNSWPRLVIMLILKILLRADNAYNDDDIYIYMLLICIYVYKL